MFNLLLFNGIMAQLLNGTKKFIIPKKDKPTEMADILPITSLSNLSYKIVSKVLCQRLKKHFHIVFTKHSQPLLLEDKSQITL